MSIPDRDAEWLEADGLGGFASGTVGGIRRRRYHAWLLADTRDGRYVLVNGCDAWIETPVGTLPISTQRYLQHVETPHGGEQLRRFHCDPWPTWEFRIADRVTIRQELFVPREQPGVAVRWTCIGSAKGVKLHVRLFLSGRDYHATHHRNGDFNFQPTTDGPRLIWRPYPSLPAIVVDSNGEYSHYPLWYENFQYESERKRGLDDVEDLASPGEFHWSLDDEPAVLLIGTDQPIEADGHAAGSNADILTRYARLEHVERRRRGRLGGLGQAIESYLVRRSGRSTIIAGYPWFTDWGRDTFIAIRGLCLASHRTETARGILLAWAETVSRGMLPNRFPEGGDDPEFNAVDASLWYVVAVSDYLRAVAGTTLEDPVVQARLVHAAESIVSGYAAGTRFGIRADDDGLLACGEPGVQLTWMDAKVGDWVVTPRIGKPVEVQALWLNALAFAGRFRPHWRQLAEQAQQSFAQRFWNPGTGCLYDVVDADHRSQLVDPSIRPNQIFAVGGLPRMCLDGQQARSVVDVVEQHLLTPLGLRTLSPEDSGYVGLYSGDRRARDAAYHQGTVWPWLIGPFVEAWLRVRGNTQQARLEARERFLPPFESHLRQAGLGHISEIADADPPHTPRGCPFQAWSLGEFLRMKADVLDVPS